jgi:pyruvate dehydrogenase E1 component alpha subunit
MPGIVVDGQDVIAVAEAVTAAVDRARKGKGPSLIECKTSRFCPHFVSAPDMCGCEIRSDEEIEELKKQDPIVICHKKLMARKILTKKTIEKIDAEVAAELEAAEKFADESPAPEPSIFDDLLYAN